MGSLNKYVGWGTAFMDYDNDGWPDIFLVTGHVYPGFVKDNMDTFKSPRILMRNLGDGRFQDVSSQSGPGVSQRFSSRGSAYGDYDNDGDRDVLVLNMNDLPSLLRNDGGNRNPSITVKLIGAKCNRTADRRARTRRHRQPRADQRGHERRQRHVAERLATAFRAGKRRRGGSA